MPFEVDLKDNLNQKIAELEALPSWPEGDRMLEILQQAKDALHEVCTDSQNEDILADMRGAIALPGE